MSSFSESFSNHFSIRVKPEDVFCLFPSLSGEEVLVELKEVLEESSDVLKPSCVYKIYDHVNLHNDFVEISGKNILCGKEIVRQLKNSTSVAIVVCTVGEEINHLYARYNDESDYIKAYLCDAVANVATELTMKAVKELLLEKLSDEGERITSHFGPGYCDWDIKEQTTLLSLVPSHLCGVSLTDSYLMKPAKSLSGMIGIGHAVVYKESRCALCRLKKCIYRKERLTNYPLNET